LSDFRAQLGEGCRQIVCRPDPLASAPSGEPDANPYSRAAVENGSVRANCVREGGAQFAPHFR
jgi:hypothetical protein